MKGVCAVKLVKKSNYYDNEYVVEEPHEYCECPELSLSVCKTMCDSDKNCKGYAQAKTGCSVATISACQAACEKHEKGNIGNLVIDSNIRYSDFEGCFIKRSGD